MTHFGATPTHFRIPGVGILTRKYENPMCTVLWQVGALFPCFFWGQKSIETINFVIEQSYDPLYGHTRPFAGVGILARKYKKSYVFAIMVNGEGALFLCFWTHEIDYNHQFWPSTMSNIIFDHIWAFLAQAMVKEYKTNMETNLLQNNSFANDP